MKSIFISDLKPGSSIEAIGLGITGIKISQDRNGRTYWDLSLVDKSGSINAKAWFETAVKYANLELKVGDICNFSGGLEEFRGATQLNISEIKRLAEGEYDMADFLFSTTKDIAEIKAGIKNYIQKISDKDFRQLLLEFMKKYGTEFFKWPAAKRNHHHFMGGLSEHVLEMLKMADSVLESYPEASADLVYAGIILHDVGKIKELEINSFAIEYGLAGNLIGHISMGVEMIDEIIYSNKEKFVGLVGSEKLILLKHVILSHHGKMEYGSPVVPKIIEAGIVSRIDILSNDARIFQRLITDYGKGADDFSPPEFTLDNARVFLHSSRAFTGNHAGADGVNVKVDMSADSTSVEVDFNEPTESSLPTANELLDESSPEEDTSQPSLV